MPQFHGIDGPIYCRLAGEGAPVLLLHHYFRTHATWLMQINELGRSHFVIAPDLRGHGNSPMATKRLRLREIVADLEALTQHLNISRIHIVGSSLGALAGLTLAHQFPERVQSLTAIGIPYLHDARAMQYMDRYINTLFENDERRLNQEHSTLGARYARDTLLANFIQDRREFPTDQIEAVDHARAITTPTLFLAGDNDPVCTPRRLLWLADMAKQSELAIIPRGGHLPHIAAPQLTTQIITDFINRHQ